MAQAAMMTPVGRLPFARNSLVMDDLGQAAVRAM
jgi:hypothetical protein